MKIFIDGQFYAKENAKISVFDHGLLYGDGIFEGIRFYNGGVYKLPEHIRRLYDSARAIHLNIGMTPEEMTQATLATIRENDLHDGYIRLLVTRGAGGLGLNPYLCENASVIIIASTIQLYPKEKYDHGLKLASCATRRPAPAALSPSVKSLNYLNNVMAKVECLNAGADEGLMLNEQGYVAECTGDNIFVIRDRVVSTPPISAGALNGITRNAIIGLIRDELKLEVREENLTRYEIFTADECFLTGTAAEVIPGVELDGRDIGDGKPGPVTVKCMKLFKASTISCATPVYR
jgi:branched-chain amino acid aminotransferase